MAAARSVKTIVGGPTAPVECDMASAGVSDWGGQESAPKGGLIRRPLLLLGLAGLLVLIRVPFYLAGDIQEDAYITWRCAVNLADSGHYSYNVPGRDCATTTHAYAFVAATMRLVFGGGFIPAVLAVNTLCLVGGTYLISAAVFEDRRRRVLLWAALALMPVALEISYCGMETGMLVLAVGVALGALRRGRPHVGHCAAVALLPWVRPDAIAFGVILVAAMCWEARRIEWRAIISLLAGVATLASFNYLLFGSILNQSIIAKEVAYAHPRTAAAVAGRLWRVFFGRSIFLPHGTKYLRPAGAAFGVLGIGLCLWALARNIKNRRWLGPLACLLAMAFLIPVAYSVGGVLFPWYLWPCQLLVWAVVLALFVEWSAAAGRQLRRLCLAGAAAVLGILLAGQWVMAWSRGTYEQLHRGGVGRYIRAHSPDTDTIFLEPAGYIPFYAQRYTYDEIGLGTPEVTAYRRRHGQGWWIRFVQDKRPDLLVQRRHMLEHRTLEGYPLSRQEIDWFKSNYELIKEFHYRPEDYYRHPLLLRILRLGSTHSYFLYRLKVRADERPGP